MVFNSYKSFKSATGKKDKGQVHPISKEFAIGLLLYGASLEIDTQLPANVEMELASVHFHRSFLDTYFKDWQNSIDVSKIWSTKTWTMN